MGCHYPGDDYCFDECDYFHAARDCNCSQIDIGSLHTIESLGENWNRRIRMGAWCKPDRDHKWSVVINIGGWKMGETFEGKGSTFVEAMAAAASQIDFDGD